MNNSLKYISLNTKDATIIEGNLPCSTSDYPKLDNISANNTPKGDNPKKYNGLDKG